MVLGTYVVPWQSLFVCFFFYSINTFCWSRTLQYKFRGKVEPGVEPVWAWHWVKIQQFNKMERWQPCTKTSRAQVQMHEPHYDALALLDTSNKPLTVLRALMEILQLYRSKRKNLWRRLTYKCTYIHTHLPTNTCTRMCTNIYRICMCACVCVTLPPALAPQRRPPAHCRHLRCLLI